MPISMPGYKEASIGAIAKALDAVHTVYGINTEVAKKKLLDYQSQQEAKLGDPNSSESKAAQQEKLLGLDFMAKKNVIAPEKASQLRSLIQGAPAAGAEGQEGYKAAVPGLSATSIHKGSETSEIAKFLQAQMTADSKAAGFSFRDSQLDERNDNRAHATTLGALRGNKDLSKAVASAQNLTNVLNNIEKTNVITPQDLHDMQGIAIQNTGLGGQSSVGERSKRYANTLGLEAANVEQFLTGKLHDIGRENPLYDRYKTIMLMEAGNMRERAEKKIDALVSGNKHIYSRRPDLANSLDEAKASILDQLPKYQGELPDVMRPGGGGPAKPPQSDYRAAALAELERRKKAKKP